MSELPIKLPLYALDPDQTHDLLFTENIQMNIFNYYFRYLLNFPQAMEPISLTKATLGLLLFERYTLDGYPWAEQYTTKLFEFYKPLSTTGLYLDQAFTGYPISEDISHAFFGRRFVGQTPPSFLFERLTVINTSDSSIYLTWFTNAFTDDNGNPLLVRINYNEARELAAAPWGKVYCKEARKIDPGQSVVIDRNCLIGSLVVSGSGAEKIESSIPEYYLYKNFDKILEQFLTTIKAEYPLMGLFASSETIYYVFLDRRNPTLEYEFNPNLVWSYDNISVSLSPIAEHYYFVSLIYGDKNLEDQGKPIKLNLSSTGDLEYKIVQNPDDLYPKFVNEVSGVMNSEDFCSPFYEVAFNYNFNTVTTTFSLDIEPTYLEEPGYNEFFQSYIDNVFSRLDEHQESENTNMPDSLRVKRIHDALQADKFSQFEKDGQAALRVANLGYYIERIARVLGISVNPDGSVRSIRQSRYVAQGDTIPPGWSIAQWGRNQGGNEKGQSGGEPKEDRDGIVYEVISNQFTENPFTGKPDKIIEGGYVLCENWLQYFEIFKDDLDKALGLQAFGANALPNFEKDDYITYEGLHALIAEIVYMQSAISQHSAQTLISSTINQAIAQELIGALGVPIKVKEFEILVGSDEKKDKAKVAYPGLDVDAPTVFNLVSLILANIAPLLAATSTVLLPKKPKDLDEFEEEHPELNLQKDLEEALFEPSPLHHIFELSQEKPEEGK